MVCAKAISRPFRDITRVVGALARPIPEGRAKAPGYGIRAMVQPNSAILVLFYNQAQRIYPLTPATE
jgi:hypothetical protein